MAAGDVMRSESSCGTMKSRSLGMVPEFETMGIRVLLAHSPEIYRQAAHAGFSVMLCGHTHGGQICLPGGIPPMVTRAVRGVTAKDLGGIMLSMDTRPPAREYRWWR